METIKSSNYVSPWVEVVEIEVEKGFATSDMEPYCPADGNGGWA